MKNSCLSEAYSIEKPENYTLIMHVITCFEVPINLFGAYCILFKTPKRMASVKWPMLILHCLCSFDDFFLSFLTIPYVYFPVLAGVPLGAWNASIFEILTLVIILGETGAAILSIFENRYYILFGQDTCWQQIRKAFLLLNYFLTPIFIIPVYLMIPEQDLARGQVRELMPCIPDNLISGNMFVLTLDGRFFIGFCVVMTVTFTFEVISFCVILIFKMSRSSLRSSNTTDLQRKFLIALGLQITIPITVLVLPITYVLISTSLNYYNQLLNNLIFCILGSHGFLSTIIMVLVHSPYRKVTLSPFYQLISMTRDRLSPHTIAYAMTTIPINS